MKVCISLRDSVPGDLHADNLRSESRWERLALEASMSNPEITDIYTAGYAWKDCPSPKYRGKIKSSSPTDCILILQDWNESIVSSHTFRGAIINVFAGPWLNQIAEIQAATARMNNNLFFTIGYPVMYRSEFPVANPEGIIPRSHLDNFATRDRVYSLPVPGFSVGNLKNNFEMNTVLWCNRIIFLSQLAQAKSITWTLEKMKTDPNLRLHIITGWSADEVKNFIDGDAVFLKEDINDAFWKLPEFQSFIKFRSRVQVSLSLPWKEVIREYSQAKLLITYGKLYGGPGIEASMHGVPFVGSGKFGAMGDCEKYLHAPSEEEACLLLEKLSTDPEFYKEISLSYYQYAVDNYSFEAFNRNLNNILRDRNLL